MSNKITAEALTITVPVEVKFESIANAMCSAFEGGSYGSKYWCGGEVTSPQENEYKWWYADAAFWARPDFEATFHHDGPKSNEGDNDVTTVITQKDLIKGLKIMAQKNPYQFSQMMNDEGDGTTGDVLLQCVVLKDVVFG